MQHFCLSELAHGFFFPGAMIRFLPGCTTVCGDVWLRRMQSAEPADVHWK